MKFGKRILAVGMTVLMATGVAACDAEGFFVEENASDIEMKMDISKPVTLNLGVMYDTNAFMYYKADAGGTGTEWVAPNGKTYRDGDLKPVWEELQNRLNFTISDVSTASATNAGGNFSAHQATGFAGVDMINANAVNINTEAGLNGTFLALDEYMDYMPNLRDFLNSNGVVTASITYGDGHLYFAPYFDGYDDLENMIMMRTDWVEKLLDTEGPYDTDRVITPYYQPYMPETLDTTVTAVTADGTGLQEIPKKYDKNIITAQNEAEVMDGEHLVQVLKDHIDTNYADVYENRSDLFIGQDAAYDADELIALYRCVLANTTFLTGQSENDAVPLFPRLNTAQRYANFWRMASIWGVRGTDSRAGTGSMLYIDKEGELQSGYADTDIYDAVERYSQMYKEGLVLQDFDKIESTAGLTGSDHAERLLSANLGFSEYDYNQTQTAWNKLDADIEGFTFTPVLPPVADWNKDGNYFMFTDSWRSVKTEGWAILSTVAEDEDKLYRALKLIDYQYSPEGHKLMSFGPDEFLDGEIEYLGEMVPKLSDATLADLNNLAGGNYTNFYRRWMGGTFPIGYIKNQGMEFQTVHPKGQVGLEKYLKALELGAVKHLTGNVADAEDPSFVMVPTAYSQTAAEEQFIVDNAPEWTSTAGQYLSNASGATDRHIFADYTLYGFGGTKPDGTVLLDKEGLRSFLMDDLGGETFLMVRREAYKRMMAN